MARKASKNHSAVSIDLGFMNASYAALNRLHQTGQKYNVTSAHIHAQSCIFNLPASLNQHKLAAICQSIGQLPRLKEVTMDLNDLDLSIRALTSLLHAKRLKKLRLVRLKMEGAYEDYKDLHLVMSSHTHLSQVSIHRCHHTDCFQGLLSNLPALERFHLSGTQFGGTIVAVTSEEEEEENSHSISVGKMLVKLCRSSQLKTLILEENANISDAHLKYWANELSHPDFTTNLQELKIMSSHLQGDISGEAICHMLLTNRTIQELTLQLYGTWVSCGATMAHVLQTNPTLASINLGIYRGLPHQVVDRATDILEALFPDKSPNSQIQRLHLHLDFDSVLDGNLRKSNLMETLNHVLDVNDQLKDVCFYDDCFYSFKLPKKVRAKLLRNKAGISKLLHQSIDNDKTNTATFENDYANAIISNQNNVDLVFYALSQNPAMLVRAAAANTNVGSRHAATTSTTKKSSVSSPTKAVHKFLSLHEIAEWRYHSNRRAGSKNNVAAQPRSKSGSSKIYRRLFTGYSTKLEIQVHA